MYYHVHMATKTVLSAFSARYSLGGECAGNVMFFGGLYIIILSLRMYGSTVVVFQTAH